MKKTLLLFLAHFFCISAFSQSLIKAKVVDFDKGEAIAYAHILLRNIETDEVLTNITNGEGIFKYKNVAKGTYQLKISFIGFQELSQEVQVTTNLLDLGTIQLKEGIDLKEVQVTEQILPAQQKGDTTEFNAEAYKTLPDASAEDLVEKMPTVVIDNGQVQAQGEDVKQVLVDGKRFFGDDPTAALKNLPAEVIDKIQVFDQQSEQSRFTGFDDGESSKTINIITKPNMRNGKFGKVYAGYGYENKYLTGGNINIFNGDQRTSIIGLSNNINQQNFATDDLLGVVGSSGNRRGGRRGGGGKGRRGGRGGRGGSSVNDFLVPQQGGISSTHAAGINFSDKWGEKINLSASYFFNQTNNITEQNSSQQFFDTRGLNNIYDETSLINSTNINHRFSGRLSYEINDKDAIEWRPNLRWQSNDGTENIFGQSLIEESLQNQTDNNFQAKLQALDFNSRLLWKHKFDKKRRTFSANLRTGYSPKTGESFLTSENIFNRVTADTSLVNQFSNLDVNSWNADLNLQYTEPVGSNSMMMFYYRASYQREESDKESFDLNDSSQDYDLFNQGLSNIFSNDYYTQQVGTGYSYRKRKLRLMVRARIQWAQLLNEQSFPFLSENKKTFWNILPMAMLRYGSSRNKSLRIFYRSNTQLPTIQQLQDVVDNSNPLQLSIGNAALAQAVQHRMVARYSNTNTAKSSVFFAMLSAAYTQDYIANSIYYNRSLPEIPNFEIEEGAQLSTLVNLNGYWNLRSFLTYGFPLAFIKTNLNIDLTGSYSRTPGLVNDLVNYSNNTSTGLGLTFSSNISHQVDFTVSSRSNYNIVKNTLQEEGNTNYLNQSTRLKFNWIFGPGLVFRTDLTHQYYDGLSEGFNQNFLLWNMSIGKKLFKNQRGEISLTVFDLLEQNNSLTRTVTESYTEDVQTNVLQRYVMLSMKYDLRHFKIK